MEKKIIYSIILDIWDLMKETGFIVIQEKQWENIINKGVLLQKKYEEKGTEYDIFFRNMFLAVTTYYVKKMGMN